LASAEKEQLATASAVFGNYDSTQSAMPIPLTRKAELILQNIWFTTQNESNRIAAFCGYLFMV